MFVVLGAVLLVLLDLLRKANFMHPLMLGPSLAAVLNAPVLFIWLRRWSPPGLMPVAAMLALLLIYVFTRLSFFPVRDGHDTGIRLKIMAGGRVIVYAALWSVVLQLAIILFLYPLLRDAGISNATLVGNVIYAGIVILLFFANGILRMFFTSRRLSIVLRVVLLCTIWIPLVNLIPLLCACRLVHEEYDFACYKKNLHLTRVDSDLCKTRYPIVMVHGVLFRDLRYFNYWGRIPKELIRYGATVYYGNQGAVGTIACSAEEIKERIGQVFAETGCEKVNIIAHSKGGLDARYAITALHLEDSVASLTTVCTPHRGCRFVDLASGMPERLYRWIARMVDRAFLRFGDAHPDFYTATRQFRTEFCEEFNRAVPNSPKVYYQSYMTKMRTALSDPMLAIPYLLIKAVDGENDGLVSTTSGKWGEFRGLLVSKGRRGISHGDIIDLKREDYRGFDVLEHYISIVSELKEMGF